jgi:hypothetical protein
LQRDLGGNDNDWQLKKLQHDSLKTSEKVVEVLRETIEREVLAQAKDYERLFGARSAQFAEYLTMVAQKLEQHGIQHSDVINWLTSTASEGSVPKDYASDLRDSQSKTVPFIAGGPMQDFGENSLLDRTLNITPSSAAPVAAQTAAPPSSNNPVGFPASPQPQPIPQPSAAPPAQPAIAAQVQVQVPRPNQVSQGGQPGPNFAQPQFPGAAPQAQPQFPSQPQPNFAQPNFAQANFAQPNFAQPNFAQPAAQPQPNLAITTSQPLPQQTGSQFAAVKPAERKDDDKYVFDPFTAWD